MSSPRGLHALARLHGIQTAYHDHTGRRVGASPEGLMAVLRGLGVPVRRAADLPAALDRRRRVLWERVVEPVVVAWLPDPGPFILRLPEGLGDAHVRVTVALEDGAERSSHARVSRLTQTDVRVVAGRTFTAYEVPLPRVPAGYHDLHVEVDGPGAPRRHRALLLAAPERSAGWEGLPGAGWGVFAPLHSLYTRERPDGIPHFGLLAALADRVAEAGGGVLGTLPMLATFLDRPYEPSPYMPVSKLFWNELYVADPDASIGNGGGVDGRRIDYRAAMAERRDHLEPAARAFFRAHTPEGEEASGEKAPTGGVGTELELRQLVRAELRVPELAAFLARNPGAADYARFRALTARHGAWTGWPDRLRARDVRPGDYDPELARYHLYAQWQAERQLAEAEERAAARGVSLYLDLPLGVHPHGYDTWRERALFSFDATVGAPPDPLAPAGQDWGIHPPHPETTRREGHRYFIAAVRKHLRFARVLRIDHIMQLHRLFWVPDGDARDGVYVRYPHEELYAILSLEAHRHGAVIVGEDLGTVPRSVRRGMREHGVPGMHVVQFSLREVDYAEHVEPRPTASNSSGTGSGADSGADSDTNAGPGLVPGRVGAGAVASIGTHDTPMFAGWWTGRDAEVRAERGLMDEAEARAQVEGRAELRSKLARGLGVGVDGVDVQAALYRVLGRSKAGLVLASLEDLWMETEPQNVPGTPAELNWRRRAGRPLEAVSEGEAARLLAVLNEARKERE